MTRIRINGASVFDPLEGRSRFEGSSFRRTGSTADIGAVETGKRADLVLVEGDPLAFVDLGSRIRAVMKDGRVVSGELPPASGVAMDRDGRRSSAAPASSAPLA